MTDHKPVRRRRRYTKAFKLQAVGETRASGVSVAEVARRHGMNANVLFHWLRDPRFNGAPVFLPVEVRSYPTPVAEPSASPQVAERLDMVIELPGGTCIRCGDEPSLLVALRALRRAP